MLKIFKTDADIWHRKILQADYHSFMFHVFRHKKLNSRCL